MNRKERKELATKRNALVREILNIRQDYSGCFPEDIPVEVSQEVLQLRVELAKVREALGT